jgi:parvulin-like peptidyl-prolyl isomerase
LRGTQSAGDTFRRRQGLTSAADTRAWLARQRLTVELFEEALEHDLLVDKLKDHLTRDRIPGHFATHQGEYARVRLRQILVPRDDLARELRAQVQEEGRDFADLARAHSQHASRVEGGLLGWVLRRALPAPVAEAVFAAREGAMVGPLATDQGFQLLLVEAYAPSQLDAATSTAIRDELFGAWLSEQLQTGPLAFPLLDVL